MLRELKRRGDKAVVHGLRRLPSNHKISADTEQEAVAILSQPVYRGFEPTLASEYLAKKPAVSKAGSRASSKGSSKARSSPSSGTCGIDFRLWRPSSLPPGWTQPPSSDCSTHCTTPETKPLPAVRSKRLKPSAGDLAPEVVDPQANLGTHRLRNLEDDPRGLVGVESFLLHRQRFERPKANHPGR